MKSQEFAGEMLGGGLVVSERVVNFVWKGAPFRRFTWPKAAEGAWTTGENTPLRPE